MRSRSRIPRVSLIVLAAATACGPLPAPRDALIPAPDPPRYSIVPAPRDLQAREGAFTIGPGTRISVDAPDLVVQAAERFAARLRTDGVLLPVEREAAARSAGDLIAIVLDSALGEPTGEGYRLSVRRRAIRLTAATPAGLLHGLETLRQLVPLSAEPQGWARSVPAVEIEDAPRFGYRGMHLDVSRHFLPVDFVKRYLDLLALYRFNTFHWHLTDDQGWRIEIPGYPRLVEVGSCRAETQVARNFDPYVGDGRPYCGHYTLEEVRDVVTHAAALGITVVPEIEMPGHSLAALAAYPELACTPGPFEVGTRWGVFDDIYCPSETTFSFLEDVLIQVMDLFPGPWIHVGGDEAPKARWETSGVAQAVIAREGLDDEDALQRWFIARIGRFLRSHGRRLIGWDEIVDGGDVPGATVMAWRSMEAGADAARSGHDVVMTPTSHTYLDYYQGPPETEPLAIGGYLPLERVYAFDPVPDGLEREAAARIAGGQGNVWTEYMTTPEHVEYMALPRMLALAEALWSPPDRRDYDAFLDRLPAQLERLDALGYRYRIPEVRGLGHDRATLDAHVVLDLDAPIRDAVTRYTTDGSDPDHESPLAPRPLRVLVPRSGVTVKARAFLDDGRVGPVAAAHIVRTRLRDPEEPPSQGLSAGLDVEYREGELRSLADTAASPVVWTTRTDSVGLTGRERPEGFALSFDGWIDVPSDGIYTFHLASDDGAVLSVGGEVAVDHAGLHAMTERSGQVALRRGLHRVRLDYFQAGGGKGLHLQVTPPDGQRMPVPATWWRR